ncbi:hypothetical protein HRbin36_00131 [bacterium HR36]|nr:hypothetical protein HRbin36_00131 [bacterium HR36]
MGYAPSAVSKGPGMLAGRSGVPAHRDFGMARYRDREHVIALRKPQLVQLLLRYPGCPTTTDEEHFRQFCRLVEAIFHFEFHSRCERLKALYAPFDPDIVVDYTLPTTVELEPVRRDREAKAAADGLPEHTGSHSPSPHANAGGTHQALNRREQIAAILQEVRSLLERANFVRLGPQALEEAIRQPGRWGLNFEVNFDLFETLELYVRGDTVEKEKVPARLFGWIRERQVEVPVYQRLLLVVRFRPDAPVPPFVDKNCLYLKLFKDVPKNDLEMLIPGTEPRIRPLDGLKIGLPLLAGLATCLWKLVMGAALTLASGVAGVLAWLGLIGAPISYGVRSYFGYVSTRQKYHLTVTQCLFFQNLDNNLGALVHLIDEAEEQEFRETVLSWFFLWRYAGQDGWTADALDDTIEQYLEQHARLCVDFEIEDALAKLQRLGLAQPDDQGRWHAVPLLEACQRLDEIWDNYFRYHRNLL